MMLPDAEVSPAQMIIWCKLAPIEILKNRDFSQSKTGFIGEWGYGETLQSRLWEGVRTLCPWEKSEGKKSPVV